MSELENYKAPSAHRRLFVWLADQGRHIDTTSQHIAAMLGATYVDVVVALWRDPSAPDGVNIWVAKGLPLLEATVARDRSAQLATVAFWLRDRAHAVAMRRALANVS
jgi:hypothetical protein